MSTKQILFRLESDIAKALENKLTEKGISKQFLFSKVCELFINDNLSFDNKLITSNTDNKQITIDSIEVAETIKRHYLNDLAELIANDSKLIAVVTERLESNVLRRLEENDNKSYQSDSKTIINEIEEPIIIETETAELEEGVSQGVITPEESYKPLTDDSRGEKGKDKAGTIDSADKPTHEGSIDDNAELVLSQNKLATRLGYKNHGHLSRKFKQLSRQEFINWTKSKDPEAKGWYKTKKGFKVVTD